MLTANIEDLIKSLEDYQNLVASKMQAVLKDVLVSWSHEIINITPVGNAIKYKTRYLHRQELYSWDVKAGLLRGNWHVSIGTLDLDFNEDYDPRGTLLPSRIMSRMGDYILGDTVYITNSTPYLTISGINKGKSIEEGYSKQAPDGVQKPSLEAIQRLYKYPFDRF